MTDEELIARLLEEETDLTDCAADRIEALTKERDEADDLAKAAFADGASNNIRLAETSYRVKTLTKERDAYARKLMQANNTYAEMHLEIERLSDKLAKTEGLLAMAMHVIKGRIHWEASGLTCGCGECQALVATVAQIEGKSND